MRFFSREKIGQDNKWWPSGQKQHQRETEKSDSVWTEKLLKNQWTNHC
jgi:hypothetical protein